MHWWGTSAASSCCGSNGLVAALRGRLTAAGSFEKAPPELVAALVRAYALADTMWLWVYIGTACCPRTARGAGAAQRRPRRG